MGRFSRGVTTNVIHIISDCLLCIVAYMIALLLTNNWANTFNISYLSCYIVFCTIFLLRCKEARLYNTTTLFYGDRVIRIITKSFLIATGCVSLVIFYVGRLPQNSYFIITLFTADYVLITVNAFIIHWVTKEALKQYAPRTILIGRVNEFEKFHYFVLKSNISMNIIGYVGVESEENQSYLGTLEELDSIIHSNGVDQVYVSQQCSDKHTVEDILHHCLQMGVTTKLLLNSFMMDDTNSYVSSIGTIPVLTYHTVCLNKTSQIVKRLMDILGGIFGIIVSSPIMLITAIVIKLTSKGPIIFKQKRIGLNGREFYIYKFRSMYQDAEQRKAELMKQNELNTNCMFKIKEDPRITKVGKFIRRTSIDELPQFFNVVKGDMSLVGTRPPTVDETKNYEAWHWKRLSIKPGITGMWQVSGRSNITDFNQVVSLDATYIETWSLILDVKILLKTVCILFKRQNAY